MAIGVSPTVDFAFKLMLGNPEHTGVTIHFLNSILDDQPRITQVEILNPFLGKESDDDKLSVLEMISQTPEQRLLYNARLKFQRDEESRLLEARQEGAIVGRIHLLQELLGLRQWTMDEFAGCDASQLAELEDQLKQQLRTRSQ